MGGERGQVYNFTGRSMEASLRFHCQCTCADAYYKALVDEQVQSSTSPFLCPFGHLLLPAPKETEEKTPVLVAPGTRNLPISIHTGPFLDPALGSISCKVCLCFCLCCSVMSGLLVTLQDQPEQVFCPWNFPQHLEWAAAVSSPGDLPGTQGRTSISLHISCNKDRFFTTKATWEAPKYTSLMH